MDMCHWLHILMRLALYSCGLCSGVILCMRPANKRWCYIVTPSLIGWVHTQTDPCGCCRQRTYLWYIAHLMWRCSISIAKTLEIPQSSTKPFILTTIQHSFYRWSKIWKVKEEEASSIVCPRKKQDAYRGVFNEACILCGWSAAGQCSGVC